MKGSARIDGLKDLTPEQDVEAVMRYYDPDPFAQSLKPEHRADWFEVHMRHAKRYGTNISEQLVITQRMADRLDRTDYASELLAYLLQPPA